MDAEEAVWLESLRAGTVGGCTDSQFRYVVYIGTVQLLYAGATSIMRAPVALVLIAGNGWLEAQANHRQKEHGMSRLLNNLLRGAGSVINLMPYPRHVDYTKFVHSSNQAALEGDILKIQQDYKKATRDIAIDPRAQGAR